MAGRHTRARLVCATAALVLAAAAPAKPESMHIFGIHTFDDGANVDVMSHRTGWCLQFNMSHETPNLGRYRRITGEGFTIIQRLDWTGDFTVPRNPAEQDDFATNCRAYAQQISKYCRYYLIGNEMELWGQISGAEYAAAFQKVRTQIRQVQPEAVVIIGHFTNFGNMRTAVQLLEPDGYDGISYNTNNAVSTSHLDLLDEENARPGVGVYVAEWGWQADTNANAWSAVHSFYHAIGQSNASRSRQIYCATWFTYRPWGCDPDTQDLCPFDLKRSQIDNPAFEAATALGTSVNSFAANPVVMSNLFADIQNNGLVTLRWNTNVPARRQVWRGAHGGLVAASTDVFDNLSTTHQLTAPGGLVGAVYEVMPSSTADGYGDAGGRRYQVKAGPWPTNITQTALDTVQVQWSTDWPSDSVVEFGPTQALGSSGADAALVTSHAVSIGGLPVGVQWYRVLSSEPAPNGYPGLAMRSPIRWFIVRSPYPGDFDGDLDVDQEDFAHLQACFTGPGNPITEAACLDADLDGDGDVDQADFEIFQPCFSGANITPPADCGDGG